MNSLPGQGEPYRIVRSIAFHTDWDAGVAAGWLNAIVHPAQVEYFTGSVLPTNPFFGQTVPGAAANVRKIGFPHSPNSRNVIEVTYAVIEDDRVIALQAIRLLA